MKLLIGLGNPGKKYKGTRHNIGFVFLDFLKQSWSFPEFEFNKKFNAEISLLSLRGSEATAAISRLLRFARNDQSDKIILARPQTFMNLSGESVHAILDFYKLSPADTIVVHDDLDLEVGKYKIATDSSSAGHNGVENIIEKIGTQKFTRLRIGIANADLRSKIEPTDFVLQKFSDTENETVKKLFPEIEEEMKKLL